ncbi:MAG: response regulator [Deltaproteobacteria bacterium]|nr:MAG: response regulator [Deltaproteobacteria bacterium]
MLSDGLFWNLLCGYFVPPGLDNRARRRARTLVGVAVSLAGIALIFVLVGLVKEPGPMLLGPAVALLAMALALPVLRRFGPTAAAHVIAAGTFACLVNNVGLSGGYASPIFYWFVVLPPIAGLIGGLRVGRLWTVVVLVVMAGLVTLDRLGLGPPVRFEAGTPALVLYLDVLGIPLSLALTVRVFLRQQAIADEETRIAMERLEAEVRVRAEAERAARIADRAKSEFLSTMSHELRTPMNGVIGMATMLETTELTDEQREYLETLQRSAEAMMALLDGLIDFTRFEEGALGLERREYSLLGLVEERARSHAGAADRKGLELVVDLDPDLPVTVVGDEARVRQVIDALLDNAVKFTEQGRVVLRIDGEPTGIRVTVEDTGIGMDEALQARVLRPLEVGDSSVRRRHGGVGMGLATVAVLVRAMGGDIGIRSAPGQGTAVWFTMALQARSGTLRETVPSLHGLRVLVMDDDDACRAAVARQLRGLGAEVIVAGDGPAAVQALQDAAGKGAPVHAGLLDLEMPQRGGLELSIALRGDPVLASTARVLMVPPGRPVTAAVAARAGVMTQVEKPATGPALASTLATLVTGDAGSPRSAGRGQEA